MAVSAMGAGWLRKLRGAFPIIPHLPAAALAFFWRTLMFRTTFIAVTGSLGKTTAKDALAAILSRVGPTVETRWGNSNRRNGIPRAILKVRPWHRFAVVEAGTAEPGNLYWSSLLIRPDVVLILKVARVHSNNFKTLEAVAREKAHILRFMRGNGIAALNGDDPHVAAMAKAARGRVVWFGSSPTFDVSARAAVCDWPDRLRFVVRLGRETRELTTSFVGTHFVNSLLGAIAAADVLGATLDQAGGAIAEVQPHQARVQPVILPGGAVMLRDDYNGSVDSFDAAIEVLRRARARRRILIVSDCSDSSRSPRERLKGFVRRAQGCVEYLVFVNERGQFGREYAIRCGMSPDSVHAFVDYEKAADFLRTELRAGDLALLRSRMADHMTRLYYALLGNVACRKVVCSRNSCDSCPQLGFRPFPRETVEPQP
ncbi:MAG: UDP-N-acetylmuramoyl-tripeptide--D-alanyl-D-alanine ligase [Bryobacteraceae bacterium]|nr:UDP-N-acetylmuramoyl-tripeptide--D-alanyl-D-alanine ligase [Bryobacteraceae bacterium]